MGALLEEVKESYRCEEVCGLTSGNRKSYSGSRAVIRRTWWAWTVPFDVKPWRQRIRSLVDILVIPLIERQKKDGWV